MSSRLGARLNDVPDAATRATVTLRRGNVEVARWRLTKPVAPDLAVVDHLARLQLAAKRLGCSLHLHDACPTLVELLNLAGLDGVVIGADPAVD